MSRAPGWPLALEHDGVGLRPLRLRDAPAWTGLRLRDQAWLEPWEGAPESAAHLTWEERHTPAAFAVLHRRLRREAREGRGLACAVTLHGRLVGQLGAAGLVRGAFDNAYLGYWVSAGVAGQGVAPTAVALLVDHLFGPVGLHRVEANVRPENGPSRRVMDKLGFREEGLSRRYLFIDGAWRDHVRYALTREDVPEGLLARWSAR